jgi:ketosteroid isomerase-like protein
MTPQELFERHLYAGMTSNPEAQAALYADDGVFEAPLMPKGAEFPHRLEGQDALREGFAAMHLRARADTRVVDMANSRYVLHTTADPEVFIVEMDAAFVDADPMSLVQIYRVRDGRITLLRDYFAPDEVG